MVVGLQDPDRVRYVAANYERLQGLFRVLVGVLVLLAWAVVISPLGDVLASPRAADFITAGSFLLIVAGAAAFLLIKTWYQRRYGRVRTISQYSGRRYLLRYAAGIITLVVIVAIDAYIGGLGDGPLNYLFFLMVGVGAVVDWWPERRFRWYYLVFGVLLLLTGLLLMFGLLPDRATPGLFLGFLVLYLIVGGLLDHLLLVRTLKSVPEE